ncbi:hypothetical protein BG006_003119 [Podila minutissima]|uniref:Crinkler effector protein N-terminal domain-containing protein n=1 Tax=Podila minutissima TaxID=64525 RepID=A0A9P5VGG7_9FUNG|nr:hypothetical protein BG006_003119 [Podila minutissima]
MLRYSNTNNMTDNITDNITDNNTSKNTINNNAMSNTTNNLLTLFCLVDGEWNPFSVEVDRTKTVDTLKDAIKDKNAIAFADVDAKMLTLWSVSIPVSDDDDDDDDEVPIYINNIPKDDRKKLKATRELRGVFGDEAAKNMIHIIVQRPRQVCPNMFKDVFLGLFRKLYDQMKERTILGSVLASIVRDEFVSVRETLAAHDYPNFSSESKLRLVVDEAQILSDKSPASFESSSTRSNLRPMYVKCQLSPVLHGFRTTGDRGELTIIYSGTGLSIRTLHWAMSSGDGIKEYDVEFPGWSSPASVQSYIDRMKEQLSDDESKRLVDVLIPSAAVDMLHKRLTGRFRPIVTAMEGIIKTGRPSEWETTINNTEIMITAWKDRARRGNLCENSAETLGLFLYRYCLLDATEIVLENEV